jgi:gas vesicle protein
MIEKRKISGLLTGLILGGAVGSTLALLYAPKPGKFLRNDISWKSRELLDDWKKNADDICKDTKDKADNMLKGAKEILNAGKNKIADETEKAKIPPKDHSKFL